jgi:hypothetical protein
MDRVSKRVIYVRLGGEMDYVLDIIGTENILQQSLVANATLDKYVFCVIGISINHVILARTIAELIHVYYIFESTTIKCVGF